MGVARRRSRTLLRPLRHRLRSRGRAAPVRRHHPEDIPAGAFPRMTFGAMAAWQAWLLIAATVALAAWVFFRKLRPPRVLVPSMLLWRRVLDESREQTLWERIRRAVSLALTIAIALAVAFAL